MSTDLTVGHAMRVAARCPHERSEMWDIPDLATERAFARPGCACDPRPRSSPGRGSLPTAHRGSAVAPSSSETLERDDFFFESSSRSILLSEHDPLGHSRGGVPDHALGVTHQRSMRAEKRSRWQPTAVGFARHARRCRFERSIDRSPGRQSFRRDAARRRSRRPTVRRHSSHSGPTTAPD